MPEVKKIRIALMTRQRFTQVAVGSCLTEAGCDLAIVDLPLLEDVSVWIEAAAQASPDVVLVDWLSRISMRTVEEILRRMPQARVLLWVMDTDVAFARKAIDAGVRGFLKADISPPMFIRCLQRVADGELWLDRSITHELMNTVAIQLSRREYQLLVLVCQGMSNKEIADALNLAEGTVKFYLSRLFRKCGVADRLELALFGLRNFFQDLPGGAEAPDLSASEMQRRILVDHASMTGTHHR